MTKMIFVPFIDAFGGVERLVVSLAKYLHENGEACEIVCFRDSISLSGYTDFPMKVVQLTVPRNSLKEGWAIKKHFKKHCRFAMDSVLVFDLNGAFYAGLFSPGGYTLHLTDPPSLLPTDISKFAPSVMGSDLFSIRGIKAEIVHQFNKRGVRKARNVIAMTKVIHGELRHRYSVDARVIRPGIQVSRALRNAEYRKDDFRFLSVSRLEENKRLDWIIHALYHLESSAKPLSHRIDWRLDLVGGGPKEEELKSLVERLGMNERVLFHGRVSDEKLESLYTNASMFLMPAIQGYGLPALEALARRVPVVLHRDSGVSEILEGSPWVSVMSDDEGALEKSIELIISRLMDGDMRASSLPEIPTDSGWSEKICRVWDEK